MSSRLKILYHDSYGAQYHGTQIFGRDGLYISDDPCAKRRLQRSIMPPTAEMALRAWCIYHAKELLEYCRPHFISLILDFVLLFLALWSADASPLETWDPVWRGFGGFPAPQAQ